MAFVHGKGATLSIDGTAVTAYTDQTSLNKVKDLFETTVFGNDDKTYIDGLREHDLSIGGKWDATADGVFAGADDGASVAFSFSPDGGTTTYSGNCFISNYNIDAPVGGGVTWTASFKPTGAVGRA
jgi:hypothetical protein